MLLHKSLGAFLLLSALALVGCGKKVFEVLDEARPQFEPLRARLRQVAADLPPPSPLPLDPKNATGLAPKPVLRENGRGNLVFLPAVQAANEKAVVDKREGVDLLLGGELTSLLGWTAQPSTLASSTMESRANKDFVSSMVAIRDRIRYLGVYRMAEFDPPVAIDEKSFRGGRAAIEFFLYDLTDGKRLAEWRLTARPNETVEYSYRKGEDQKAALEGWAHSSIWTNMRKALFESLPERIGGEYQDRR